MNSCNILDAGMLALRVATKEDSLAVIDATGNWWGTTDSALIEADIYHNHDNAFYPTVDFLPCAQAYLILDSSCCTGLTGNVDGDPSDIVDLGDLTALIDYLFISMTPPVCMEEANVDGDISGIVDLGDLTALIDFLFITYTPPAECL